MKKKLLLLFSLVLTFNLVAQTPLQKQNERLSKISLQKTNAQLEYTETFQGIPNPYVSADKNPDIVVGNTRYDLQTNATAQRRIHAYNDGTIAAAWIRGTTEPSFPERGTGYNYFNGTTWGPIPTSRIEPVRTGWGEYQPYGANGEIICAHTGGASGLIFSHRPNKGTGAWSHFYLAAPVGFPSMFWPRMMTSGPNRSTIHVLAVIEGSYQGLTNALLYSRSVDGGASWNPRNVVLEGISANDIIGISGDVYAWAAPKGDTIAFVVGDFLDDGIVMKSTDGGDTWNKMLYYQAPIPRFNNTTPLPRHGGIDGYQSAVIDNLGRVHVAAGRMMHSADGTGGPTNYFPYSNGLLYWNETLPPLDSAKVKSNILDPSGMDPKYLLAKVFDNGVDSIVGVATYQASLTSMPQLAFDYQNKILYAFYSALSVGFYSGENNFRHIWMRFSDDYGVTWSPYRDLTGTIFQIFSECVYPSVSANVTTRAHVLYQSDNQPGNSIRFTGHAVNDNNIVYLPINRVVGINEKPANILDITQIAPNPASDFARLIIQVDQPVNATVSLVNIIGQEVYKTTSSFGYAGPHEVKIEVRNLEAGIYFVNVNAGNSSTTKKLVVK